MAKMKRLSVELAVFLMIALVAFGGFVTIPSTQSSDDLSEDYEEVEDGGDKLTGDVHKKIRRVGRSIAKPFESAGSKVKAEGQRFIDKSFKAAFKMSVGAASNEDKKKFVKFSQDSKKFVQTTGIVMAVVSGIGIPMDDAPRDAKFAKTYGPGGNVPEDWQGGWPIKNNPTIKVDESTVALWGQSNHGSASSIRDLMTDPDGYANKQLTPIEGGMAYRIPVRDIEHGIIESRELKTPQGQQQLAAVPGHGRATSVRDVFNGDGRWPS